MKIAPCNERAAPRPDQRIVHCSLSIVHCPLSMAEGKIRKSNVENRKSTIIFPARGDTPTVTFNVCHSIQ
ncbi:MAG: hypothetical protein KBC43_12090 [Bacteroidales bacterium]|nr:hypothetical protein [Bacteroidales bacterium]